MNKTNITESIQWLAEWDFLRRKERAGGNPVITLTPSSETVVNTEEHFECCSSCY